MRIKSGKIVRLTLLLLVAFSTFVTGILAFYFYKGAAFILFQPNQPASETTQSLTTPGAASTPFEIVFMQPSRNARDNQPTDIAEDCGNCVQDETFGLSVPVKGEYVNEDYHYWLKIPEEIQAFQSPPPAQNRGFAARILSEYAATIYVDANHNKAFLNSADKAADEEIKNLREKYGDSVFVLKREGARLGKRAAIRYTALYSDDSTRITMIEEGVVALRKAALDEDEFGIIYSLKLRTPNYSYKESSAVFEKILKRWREMDMRCGC